MITFSYIAEATVSEAGEFVFVNSNNVLYSPTHLVKFKEELNTATAEKSKMIQTQYTTPQYYHLSTELNK